jgi:ribosomal-protein-alanine N-acetyltransferase
MQSIPRIKTDRLALRAIFRTDSAAVYRLLSDPSVVEFYDIESLEDQPAAIRVIDGFTARFQHGEAARWGIFLQESDELIGSCCLEQIHANFRRCNLGYNLRSDYWGRGLATEACEAIIRMAFESELGMVIDRLQAITVPANIRSEMLLKRLGFRCEGLLRSYGFWKGKSRDMHMFGMTKLDWLERTA